MSSPPSQNRCIVWFRGKDLRVRDHQALTTACQRGDEVLPLFIVDPYFFDPVRCQALPHRIQFLLDSLHALDQTLRAFGTRLHVVRGSCHDILPLIVTQWHATEVFAQRWSDPLGRKRDEKIQRALRVPFTLTNGETLHPPGSLRNKSGGQYKVFTPFSRAFRENQTIQEPTDIPKTLPGFPASFPTPTESLPTMKELGLSRNEGLQRGGEDAAQQRLAHFLANGLDAYNEHRDRMDLPGTSRLSADLKFGTLSPRQVWHAVNRVGGQPRGRFAYLNELIWREFSHSTLWDQPELLQVPFRLKWVGFPWRDDEAAWDAWVHGKTGYPIVDAACRQLLRSGFVHNRARMISASFLTKHLMIDYQRGAAHYLKWLTDGDWAQNIAGWQWSAGCGVDAQPYFRVFNPMSQGKKFDPNGDYVRKWVPELRALPTRYIHEPWAAPPLILASHGIELGTTYPLPIVDHPTARKRFLAEAKAYLS